MAVVLELSAQTGRPPILPDDRAMNRPAGGAMPQQRRFALIGNADGDDVAGARVDLAHRASASLERCRPQILRFVFDFAVGRKMLGEFLLGQGRDRGVGTE